MPLSPDAKGAIIGGGVVALLGLATWLYFRAQAPPACPSGGYPSSSTDCEMGYYYSPEDGGCCVPMSG